MIYSGYLRVSEDRQLHYILAESETKQPNTPLVIWLNGGPGIIEFYLGCSSMEGFMAELGPFVYMS